MSDLGALDIVILIFVLLGLWNGFRAGFIKSVVSLVGWFIALVAGTRLAEVFAPSLAGIVDSEVLQLALAFLLVVLVVICVVHLFGSILTRVLSSLRLGFLDKLAGGILGTARNLLVVLVIMSATAPMLVGSSFWQSSKLSPELLPYSPMAKTLAQKVFGQAWGQLNQSSQPQEVVQSSF